MMGSQSLSRFFQDTHRPMQKTASHSGLIYTLLLASISFLRVLSTATQVPIQLPIAKDSPSRRPRPHNEPRLISHTVEAYIHSLLSTHSSPGLAVAVVLKDPSVPTGFRHQLFGAGNARTSSFPPVPVTPDTLFAIASNSKLFTAVSAGLLISNSSLDVDWTTKVATLIPEWGLADPIASQEATVLDLLVHRTGMPRHDYARVPLEGGVPAMIADLRHLRPSAPFRSTFQYNNMMYGTISHLPKRLLNVSFESFVHQHIFKLAGMNASTYSVEEAEARRYPPGYIFPGDFNVYRMFANHAAKSIPVMAEGHQYSLRDFYLEERGELRPTVPYYQRPGKEHIGAGPGGILTSIRDMVPWLSTLLNGGTVPQTNLTLIPPEVLDRLETGVMVSEGKAAYPELSPKVYGPAQWRYTYHGHEIIEHGGDKPGFKTQVARLPNLAGKVASFPNATGLGIAVFSNDADGSVVLESVKFRIIDNLLGLEEIDWYSRFVNETETYYAQKRRMAIPRPRDPQPPPRPISTLQEYFFQHPSYGLLQPCYVPPGSLSIHTSPSIHREHAYGNKKSSTNRAQSCAAFLQHPTTQLLLSKTPADIPTLVMPFPRTFATHLRLTHWSGPWFNVTIAWGNHREHESKDEKNRILIGLDERFEAEWVTYEEEEGLAFRGGIWGMEGPDATAPEDVGRKGAEVWFTKV
ncbi:hypothetical protein C0995_007674 [Termitomyces sp. Mi166|nr:hypothetical protein C0995_007674 [Termitomyces sp. Mi166\